MIVDRAAVRLCEVGGEGVAFRLPSGAGKVRVECSLRLCPLPGCPPPSRCLPDWARPPPNASFPDDSAEAQRTVQVATTAETVSFQELELSSSGPGLQEMVVPEPAIQQVCPFPLLLLRR